MQSLIPILLVLGAFNLILGLFLALFVYRAYGKYKLLTEGIDHKDFATILSQIKKDVAKIQSDLSATDQKLNQVITDNIAHIQKLGFIRFNPFGNTGGDQSFCLSLLDQEDNGILITSLHSRDITRLYTKEISGGKPVDQTELSKEEKQVLTIAKKWSKR